MRQEKDTRRKNRNQKLNRKLADMAKGSYKGIQESEAEIDQLPLDEVRERCKRAIRANRKLLYESKDLPVRKRDAVTQTE